MLFHGLELYRKLQKKEASSIVPQHIPDIGQGISAHRADSVQGYESAVVWLTTIVNTVEYNRQSNMGGGSDTPHSVFKRIK